MSRKDDPKDPGRLEAVFKRRELQKAEAPIAMQEYRAAQQAVLERTKRLRAERLARENATAVNRASCSKQETGG
jgi:hypothetical protein